MVDSIQGMNSLQSFEAMRPQALTDDQKQQVADILSQYDPENVTQDDAKSIFKAFKDAGLRGPGLKDAIEEAGFDAKDLRSKGMEGMPHHQHMGGGGQGQVNVTSLKTLQDILNQYDLTNLSDDDQSNLTQQLQDAGFNEVGDLIDVKS